MLFKRSKSSIHKTANLYGDYEIGEGTKIGAFADIGGKIGKNCKVQTMCAIPPLTVIEDNVFLGAGVKIINDKYMNGNMKGITIHRGAKIGAGAIIMADVGVNAIVGGGSVVTKYIPAGQTWFGNPAKKVK